MVAATVAPEGGPRRGELAANVGVGDTRGRTHMHRSERRRELVSCGARWGRSGRVGHGWAGLARLRPAIKTGTTALAATVDSPPEPFLQRRPQAPCGRQGNRPSLIVRACLDPRQRPPARTPPAVVPTHSAAQDPCPRPRPQPSRSRRTRGPAPSAPTPAPSTHCTPAAPGSCWPPPVALPRPCHFLVHAPPPTTPLPAPPPPRHAGSPTCWRRHGG